MLRLLKIYFLLILMNPAEITRSQNSEDLPPLLHKAVEEVMTGKYLNALLDILHFQSSDAWTADMVTKVMAYFHAREVKFTLLSLQTSIQSYLKNLLYQPRQLLSAFQQLDQQQFQTAMKYLFNSRKDYLCCLQEMGNVILDWEKTRERIFQIPGVNRTLFLITLEKCFLTLRAMDCVDILSQILRMSAVSYLQPDVIGSLPNDLQEDAFRKVLLLTS